MAETRTKPTKAVVGSIIAAVGSFATALVALVGPSSPLFVVLTLVIAACTAAGVGLGVYQATNAPLEQ